MHDTPRAVLPPDPRPLGETVRFHAHALAGEAIVGMSLGTAPLDLLHISAPNPRTIQWELQWGGHAPDSAPRHAIARAAWTAAARAYLTETGDLAEYDHLCDAMTAVARESTAEDLDDLTADWPDERWEAIAEAADLEVTLLWPQIHAVANVVTGRPEHFITADEITDITGIPNPRPAT